MTVFKSLQVELFSTMKIEINLEEHIPNDHLSRHIARLVDELDLSAIEASYSPLGQKAIPPKCILNILFYGYTQGVRSGGQLSDLCRVNLIYLCLSGGLQPSKSTINAFRRKHFSHFKFFFKQIVSKCIEQGLVDTQVVYGDGTKIRANASVKRAKTKEQ